MIDTCGVGVAVMDCEIRCGGGRRSEVPMVWGVGTGACVLKSPSRMRSVSGYWFRIFRVILMTFGLSAVGLV